MDTKIIRFDIVRTRSLWFLVSAVVILSGMASLAVRGLNVGVDFTGGRILQYEADVDLTTQAVQKVIDKINEADEDFDIENNPVQVIGDGKNFQVRVKDYADEDEAEALQKALKELRAALAVEFTGLNPEKLVLKRIEKELSQSDIDQLAEENALDPSLIEIVSVKALERTETDREQRYNATLRLKGDLAEGKGLKKTAKLFFENFGGHRQFAKEDKIDPVFGKSLIRRAVWTLLLATVLILLYVTLRFEFWFAVAAIIALFHDCIVAIGMYSILQLEVNSATVAVILTVFGYSINDTIVIFDRIRENSKKYKRDPLSRVINYSLWETVARSVNTSVTTAVPVAAIIIYGGASLGDFATGMLIGIITGAYSSIFIAATFAFMFKSRTKDEGPAAAPEIEAPPPAAAARPAAAPAAEPEAAKPAAAPAKVKDKKKKKKKKKPRKGRRK